MFHIIIFIIVVLYLYFLYQIYAHAQMPPNVYVRDILFLLGILNN